MTFLLFLRFQWARNSFENNWPIGARPERTTEIRRPGHAYASESPPPNDLG